MDIKSCPAFGESCPFAKEEALTEGISKCPAFSNHQCPFSKSTDLDSMKEVFHRIPESHAVGATHGKIVEVMSSFHGAVSKLNTEGCPIFSDACPFKNATCTNGVPLIRAIEYHSWAARLLEHSEKGDEGIVVAASISKLLKEGTKAAHRAAENVHFIRELVKNRVEVEVYKQMLANLYFVYTAMEDALELNSSHPLVAPIMLPGLSRVAAIEEDLSFYFGPDYRSKLQSTPAADRYVSRLKEISLLRPELLVPHAYTRLLSILSFSAT